MIDQDIELLNLCPGCGANEITLLSAPVSHKIFLTDAEEMSITTGVSGCDNCGLTFLNPRLSQSKLFEYYSKQSRIPRSSIDPNSPFANLIEMQLDFIEKAKSIQDMSHILEVGCAEGYFLEIARQRGGSNLVLYGVELSEKYIEQAKRVVIGINLFQEPLELVEFGDVKYDLIVLRHVFEHLTDPEKCLKKIRKILKPDGLLYIEVPDSQNIEPSISRFYHHEHMLYFTPEVLTSYLGANAFKSLKTERFEENPIGSGFSYPVIRSISVADEIQYSKSFPGYAKNIYQQNDNQQKKYFKSLIAPLQVKILNFFMSNKKIGIFGAGPHTMDLLELLGQEKNYFSKIFDNNQNKHGKTMLGIPIVKPDRVSLKSVDCILVSSAEFEKEMVEQIHALVGSTTEIIRIYDNS